MTPAPKPEKTCTFQVMHQVKKSTGIFSSEVTGWNIVCVISNYSGGYSSETHSNISCNQDICPLWRDKK